MKQQSFPCSEFQGLGQGSLGPLVDREVNIPSGASWPLGSTTSVLGAGKFHPETGNLSPCCRRGSKVSLTLSPDQAPSASHLCVRIWHLGTQRVRSPSWIWEGSLWGWQLPRPLSVPSTQVKHLQAPQSPSWTQSHSCPGAARAGWWVSWPLLQVQGTASRSLTIQDLSPAAKAEGHPPLSTQLALLSPPLSDLPESKPWKSLRTSCSPSYHIRPVTTSSDSVHMEANQHLTPCLPHPICALHPLHPLCLLTPLCCHPLYALTPSSLCYCSRPFTGCPSPSFFHLQSWWSFKEADLIKFPPCLKSIQQLLMASREKQISLAPKTLCHLPPTCLLTISNDLWLPDSAFLLPMLCPQTSVLPSRPNLSTFCPSHLSWLPALTSVVMVPLLLSKKACWGTPGLYYNQWLTHLFLPVNHWTVRSPLLCQAQSNVWIYNKERCWRTTWANSWHLVLRKSSSPGHGADLGRFNCARHHLNNRNHSEHFACARIYVKRFTYIMSFKRIERVNLRKVVNTVPDTGWAPTNVSNKSDKSFMEHLRQAACHAQSCTVSLLLATLGGW